MSSRKSKGSTMDDLSMPMTQSFISAIMILGLFAGLSMVSGFSIEHLAVAAFVGLALFGGGFVFWCRDQHKASIPIVHHLIGWLLPLIGAAVAYYLS